MGLHLLTVIWSDIRFGLRSLARSPGFTAVAVLSLALGIGANTAIFTLANQVLFDRLAVSNPKELQLFTWTAPEPNVVHHVWDEPGAKSNGEHTTFLYSFFTSLLSSHDGVDEPFAFKNVGRVPVTVAGSAVAMEVQLISGNYYDALRIKPRLGRPILMSDDTRGASVVATISDEAWTTYFGRSPSVLGQAVRLNGRTVVIVGVNERTFTGASSPQVSPDIFLPFSAQPTVLPRGDSSLLDDQRLWWVQIMARSNNATSRAVAENRLDVQFRSAVLAKGRPAKGDSIPHLVLSDGSRGLNMASKEIIRPMYLLLGLAGLVLLVACVNISTMMVARSAGRQNEINIRLALGASRARIIQQMLTESFLLSAIGGLAGLLIALPLRNILPHLMTSPWKRPAFDGHLDWRVFGWTAGLSIISGMLFGLVPAFKTLGTKASLSSKDQTVSTTYREKGLTGRLFVVCQITVSTVLVVCAFLFVRTLANLASVDAGFRSDHLLLFTVDLPAELYFPPKDVILINDIEDKIRSMPGVESVAASSIPMLAELPSIDNFVPTDSEDIKEKDSGAWDNAVGQDFLSTIGIPMLSGRSFDNSDTRTSLKVAIISRSLARLYYPNQDPIGKHFRGYYIDDQEPFQIIGVCGDAHVDSLRHQPTATYYVLYRQLPHLSGQMTFQVQTHAQPRNLIPVLREAVHSVDGNIPLMDIRTQEEQNRSTIQQEWLLASLAGSFGGLAVLLACVGIYGTVSYSVARRRKEFGIRIALGAKREAIVRMVLSQAVNVALAGTVLGISIALLLGKYVRSMLFGIAVDSPVVLLGAVLMLGAVSILAALLPAISASRIEPMRVLHNE